MKKLIIGLCILLFLLTTSIAFAGSTTINYGGTKGQISINTSTPGYDDEFSMNAGGDFFGFHSASPYSLSREAQFNGGGDIYAVTCASDMVVGIAIKGNTGYLGEDVDVSSSLDAHFLAQASGCSYLIDSYVGDSLLGIGMILNGNGYGELGGDISVYNPALYADVYALGYGSGTFGLYAFAPYMNFGAEIRADSLYTDVYMSAYDAWIDIYSTFDSYLEGYGSVNW